MAFKENKKQFFYFFLIGHSFLLVGCVRLYFTREKQNSYLHFKNTVGLTVLYNYCYSDSYYVSPIYQTHVVMVL